MFGIIGMVIAAGVAAGYVIGILTFKGIMYLISRW